MIVISTTGGVLQYIAHICRFSFNFHLVFTKKRFLIHSFHRLTIFRISSTRNRLKQSIHKYDQNNKASRYSNNAILTCYIIFHNSPKNCKKATPLSDFGIAFLRKPSLC